MRPPDRLRRGDLPTGMAPRLYEIKNRKIRQWNQQAPPRNPHPQRRQRNQQAPPRNPHPQRRQQPGLQRLRVSLGVWQSQGRLCHRCRRTRRCRKHGRGGGHRAAHQVCRCRRSDLRQAQIAEGQARRSGEKDQLLAEIDPVLADTALTAANAALESMTAQRA
jgi:hypothetical protein